MKYLLICFALLSSLMASSQKVKKWNRTLYFNAKIYTVDSSFSVQEAMVVENGKISAVGKSGILSKGFGPANMVDLKGKFVYPGFIDAHCHLFGLGVSMQIVDLVGTKSIEAVVERCKAFAKLHPEKKYIMGRGWDQNDWAVKAYPNKEILDKDFPNIPVVLKRIDGHAAWVNSITLELSKIDAEAKVEGGEILLTDGKPNGILIDNAVDLVMGVIPKMNEAEKRRAYSDAMKVCNANGLTSVLDAGIERDTFLTLREMWHNQKTYTLNNYQLFTPTQNNLESYFIDIDSAANDNDPVPQRDLKIKGLKVYVDGALGSRGALLLQPYTDRHESRGFLLTDVNELKRLARLCYKYNYQFNTHCLGDSAVRLMLNIMGEVLGGPNDRRWRIEHCQIVAPEDLALFKKYSIIPSVQPTHATSDMYWAGERLGIDRLKTAYANKDLLKAAGTVALGTDFPVEAVSPLYTFASAVWRMDDKEFPKGGFQMENALTREEALRGMTIWAAHSIFEEKNRGSLEKRKYADFVILDKDLMKCTFQEARNNKVLGTYLSGEKVY